MTVANDLVSTIVGMLPSGVMVADSRESFERASTVLKLTGPGLPAWCEEPPNGEEYVQASAAIGNGTFTIVPCHNLWPPKRSAIERLLEGGSNQN